MSDANASHVAPRGWATKWTDSEDLILINNYSSKNMDEILKMLPNRSRNGIFNRAHKLGIKYHSYNENYFDIIDDPTKAYWLGFLYTDGYVSAKDNRWGIEIAQCDIKHLENFNSDMESNIQIRKRTRDFRGKKISDSTIINTIVDSCSLIYNNANMHRALVDKGVIPNKTKIMKFPTLDQIPKDYIKDFIRGLFDGDGSYCHYKNKTGNKSYTRIEVTFTCASYDFIVSLRNVIQEECGVCFNINCAKRDKLWVLRTGKKESIVSYFDYVYYDENVRCLYRKKEKSKEMLDIVSLNSNIEKKNS